MTAQAVGTREHSVVIGLEVHVQLETRSKIFCGCGTDFEDSEPNAHTCPTCLGLPGALPVLNEAAVEGALKLAAAIDADVPEETRFHRKNYYYPDLPKNFQITQYDSPLCQDGELTVTVEDDERTIAIERAHLEEDPGSLQHAGGGGGIDSAEYTRVDYNRAGVPLMEIVTEPDFRSPEEVRAFLAKLEEVLEYLGIFDSSRDGSLRIDANISLVPEEAVGMDGEIGPDALAAANRTEVKNISSHRGAEQALAYEVTRQRNAIQRDRTVEQETRHWDESRGVTVSMRSKEEEKDYRYFPEADLPVLRVAEWAKDIEIPELPDARRERFAEDYGLNPSAARKLTSTRAVADFYERTAERFDPAVAASWVADTLLGELNYRDMAIADVAGRLEEFLRLIELAETDEITEKNAEEVVLRAMLDEGLAPDAVVEREGLEMTGEDEIERVVEAEIEENSEAVADYYAGEDGALNFLVGQVMQSTGGSADPGAVNQILQEQLNQEDAQPGGSEWDIYQELRRTIQGLSNIMTEVTRRPRKSTSGELLGNDIIIQDRFKNYQAVIGYRLGQIEIEDINQIRSEMDEAGEDRYIIIPNDGFTDEAIKSISTNHIIPLTPKPAEPSDIGEGIRYINLNMEMRNPDLNVVDIDVQIIEESQEGREFEAEFNRQNSMLYNRDKEPTGETLLDRLTTLMNSKGEGEYVEEFNSKLLQIDEEYYQLNSITYEISISIMSSQRQIDLFDSVNTSLIDEHKGDRKLLPQRLRSIMEELHQDSQQELGTEYMSDAEFLQRFVQQSIGIGQVTG